MIKSYLIFFCEIPKLKGSKRNVYTFFKNPLTLWNVPPVWRASTLDPLFKGCLFSNKMNKISNLFSPVSSHGYLLWAQMTAHAQGGYKQASWMVTKNQDTGKTPPNPENVSETMTCSRSALHQPLVWALSICPLCSDSPTWLWDILCFPTYQEMNSEIEIRDEQILPWLLLCWFSSGPWYMSLVQSYEMPPGGHGFLEEHRGSRPMGPVRRYSWIKS